ncbi:hypothetical protein TRVA0_029S01178 [Trichomonascus vanleenenianus]|uniref:SAGA histone acetyltransferase complex subunit SGF11 n=1 Tax=Trichomonascus vanleenenianus TaxID=2268995 RepID=UPI003ECA25EC
MAGENTENNTLGSLSVMIFKDLLKPLTHEATLKAIQKEKVIRRKYGKEFIARTPTPGTPQSTASSAASTPKSRANGTPNGSAARVEVHGRIIYSKLPGRDIYGKEKNTQVQYFECSNCKRKVAGSRFAAHIERCLSGRNNRSSTKSYEYDED